MKFRLLLFFFLMLLLDSCGTSKSMRDLPVLTTYNTSKPLINRINDSLFTTKNGFLLKNKQQLWELYATGNPLEIGYSIGGLTDSLLKKQEKVFFSKIEKTIPSTFSQKMLRLFLKWYNRKLYSHVPEEYKAEIYGISQYSAPQYDKIAPPYLRTLYLHGAHDIGHALQDLALVGCSSFAVWGTKSADGNLILGRNFDFYAGDDFAKDKIISFIKPNQGYPYMSVSWAGMIGVCSGMNNQGLTVTINAGKSKVPLVAKTPISIVTRAIIQYAKNIEEAVAIARKHAVFVSESIMVGSALDNKAVLIEMSPDNFDVFDLANDSKLVCTNHFQSKGLKNNKRNQAQIVESHSKYRWDKLNELLKDSVKITPTKAVAILRNKNGLNNLPLGFGNEKALNQLLAHHGIVFLPQKKQVWVSANPYQLGQFVCYDLNRVFDQKEIHSLKSLQTDSLLIAKDPFLESQAYTNYELFRIENQKMDVFLKDKKTTLSTDFIANYQSLNPDYWVAYYKIGLYYYRKKEYKEAKKYLEKALSKEITTLPQQKEIDKHLVRINRKLK